MKVYETDTICAISTPPGEGGIGIVKVSGEGILPIVEKLFIPVSKGKDIIPGKIHYGKVVDINGSVIDKGIGLYFKAPHSYTGEDVFEFQVHGSMLVLNRIMENLVKSGCRIAEPGEFTKRAFLNGKLDLIEAEAVAEIIESKSEKAARNAELILEGKLSGLLKSLRDNLKEVLVNLESAIDFPEEDIEIESYPEIINMLRTVKNRLEALADSYTVGKIYNEGIILTIAGKPNVGKSKLLNLFSERNRAIVSDIEGTTRDFIEEFIKVNGIPVKIVDTAGIRESDDPLEMEGVKFTKEKIKESDIILFVMDLFGKIDETELLTLKELQKDKTIVVLNKADLVEKPDKSFLELINGFDYAVVSAKTGFGLSELKELIYRKVIQNSKEEYEGIFLTSLRQKKTLENALESINGALKEVKNDNPPEFVAMFVRGAIEQIGYLVGEFYNDEILDEIFGRFCIGK